MKTLPFTLALCCSILLVAAICAGAEEIKPAPVAFSGTDVTGAKVSAPDKQRVSVLAFLRADQPQSREALVSLKKAIPDDSGARVIVIVSGQSAADQAKSLAAAPADCPWPVVPDPEFTSSGQLSVHVWPTTVVIRPDGQQAGHLAGMPISYAADLQAYLDSASNKIDAATLKDRLTNHEVVQDDAAQMAARHLQVAKRLLETGDLPKAKSELQTGLKLQPQNPALLLVMAQVHLFTNDPKSAQSILDKLPENSVPSWQLHLLRGRAFIAQNQWPEAKAELPQALKLNPSPAETHYLLGYVSENEKDFAAAATHYRQAFEATSQGAATKIAGAKDATAP
jgi:hypothetical protein